MKRVSALSSVEEGNLHDAIKGCDIARVRQRAQAVLWSAMGYSRTEISKLLFVVPDVVTHWLDRWEANGLAGLYDAPRSGRPAIYTGGEAQQLRELVDATPQQLAQVQSKMVELTGKRASRDTLKRMLKKIPLPVEALPAKPFEGA